MNTKNILIISAVYPPEPVVSAKLSKDLYDALKDLGYGVQVIHPRPTRPNGFDFGDNIYCGPDEIVVESYTCPKSSLIGRFRESWSFGKACERYIKEHHENISVVYSVAWPIFAQNIIVKCAMKYDIPAVVHVQDVYPEALTNKLPVVVSKFVKSLLMPMDKYTVSHAQRVIAISEKMKKHLALSRQIDDWKIDVVINWQDEKKFLDYKENNADAEPNDKFTMMYMGNIGPVAGVDLLIDAFSSLNNPDIRLVIAGSGSMKDKLKEQAAKTPHVDIQFWDVPDGMVPEIQSKADLMLLPIKKGAALSSIPSKLPAYMFSAKPIIGSMDLGCDTADAIREADCGFIVEPENVGALKEIMAKAASLDKGLLNEMGAKGQKYALDHYSKSINLKKFVESVIDVINANQ